MRRMLVTTAVTLAVALGPARGQGLVDQATTCNDGGSAQIRHHEPIAQRFRPRAPNLVAVEVMLSRFNPPWTDTLALRVRAGSVGGAFVAGATRAVAADAAPAWHRFDLVPPALVVPGAPYVIELDASNAALGWVHQYEVPPRCSYPDGEELVAGAPVPGLDAAFRTYTRCGDGVLDPGEGCDDGNRVDTDGCSTACTRCGDGVVRAPEACDDGNLVSGDGCDANCTPTGCGNGVVTGGETCDDGNRVAGDCCSPVCRRDAAGTACVDDGNECTDDVCDGAAACRHVPNAAPCNDGNVCNGADACAGGACAVHAGNPCGSQPVCRRACVPAGAFSYGCRADAAGTACPADADPCTLDACNGAGLCTHARAPDGTRCEDGDPCSVADACQAGTCRPGRAVVCDPCLACEAGRCVVPTALACSPAAPGGSSVVVRDAANPRADRITWKWRGLGGLDAGELGDPGRGGGGFVLCVFEQGTLRLSARAPGGGGCAGRACWRELPTGYRYVDPEGTPDGVLKLQARAGSPATARLAVKARGPALGIPPLDLATPVTVRLQRTDAPRCWQATYSTPTASDVLQFKAKSD